MISKRLLPYTEYNTWYGVQRPLSGPPHVTVKRLPGIQLLPACGQLHLARRCCFLTYYSYEIHSLPQSLANN
jgi:hypothetical protein